ncbi:tyrosine-type recombinase/integrase [Porphyrobacter algicida]|uniref:Tyrosine-type recombinase/integrase n=1 Tax=Qipengyuania algicida TaxID=1836209 RepID=A0A845AK75_9SPHN|nr:site-specific integrase [Qipengyuania algicida]MXP29817.1 tyrosine-type recombinase/integrase [Qipengyuania algicida]
MVTRARNKLTARQVASFTDPGVYSDGGGLYLRIRESGRSWYFIGTLNRKRLEMGLGSALDVSLAKAREKAEAARQEILEGRDPREARKASAEQAAPIVTFGKFAMEFLDGIEDGFKNRKHRQQWRNTLKTYAASLFDVPIDAITTDQVLAVLQPIWLTKPETASRVRGRIERILDAAKVKGLRSGENPARGRGHLSLLLPTHSKQRVKHHPALPFAQMASFMAKLRTRDAMAAKALEFTILTAARSGETRGMTWGEVDLNAKVWTVPASRMKAGVEHQVPLSDPAVTLLNAVATEKDARDDIIFYAPRGGALSDMSMLQLLKRMGHGDITVHGFRSAFRDWAGEKTAFDRETVELALAHTIGSSTERAYRRGRALEKRRDLMAEWAVFCDVQAEEAGSTGGTTSGGRTKQ